MARKKVSLETGKAKETRGRPKDTCVTCGGNLTKMYTRATEAHQQAVKEAVDPNDSMTIASVRVTSVNGRMNPASRVIVSKATAEKLTDAEKFEAFPEGSKISVPTGRYKSAYKFLPFGSLCLRCGVIVERLSEEAEIIAEMTREPLAMPQVFRSEPSLPECPIEDMLPLITTKLSKPKSHESEIDNDGYLVYDETTVLADMKNLRLQQEGKDEQA